ncbi:MAG: hypothetical protein JW395_2511 [Nitrospira sp.]|nr:hypothetical protein [Nitrospira sp.]
MEASKYPRDCSNLPRVLMPLYWIMSSRLRSEMRRADAFPTLTKLRTVGSPLVPHLDSSSLPASKSSENASFILDAGLAAPKASVDRRNTNTVFMGEIISRP